MENKLYPDIESHGSLGVLLRTVCTLPDDVEIQGFDESFGGSKYWASIKSRDRSSDVSVGLRQRVFLAPLWNQGVKLATLSTPSLPVLVRALNGWFGQRYNTKQLKRLVSAVEISAFAPDYEAGAMAYVTHQWNSVEEYIRKELPKLYPVLLSAKAAPALRQLLPYTSHDRLCFSRCTGYPFTNDCPTIVAEDHDRFGVFGVKGERLGGGIPEEAVNITIACLPVGCGRAVHGTADNVGGAQPAVAADPR